MQHLKINYPWVEVEDRSDGSLVISLEDVSAVYDNNNGWYKYGIRFKDSSWLDNVSVESLKELKTYLMTKEEKEEDN